MNSEGYRDPTAERAVSRSKDVKAGEVVKLIKRMAEICGYEVVGKINLRHKTTGKKAW